MILNLIWKIFKKPQEVIGGDKTVKVKKAFIYLEKKKTEKDKKWQVVFFQ